MLDPYFWLLLTNEIMNKFPLIVSYYTKDTLYQLEVQNLIASCKNWGLEHCVEPVASMGSWEKNCCYKPFFLMEKLLQFKRPLFWLDADAVFLREPRYLEVFKKDIATRINKCFNDDHPSKVITGSLYINATQPAADLLKTWGQQCIAAFSDPDRREEVWDQMILRDILFGGAFKGEIETLPLEYTAIVDHPDDQKEVGEIVIAHYQASRRFKKMINSVS